MRILLVGEYSRLHNSLKEGLIALGHEVVLIGESDKFKKYPVDEFVGIHCFENIFLLKKIRGLLHKLTGADIGKWETAYRFMRIKNKLKGFDAVQFINSNALDLPLLVQRKAVRFIKKHNGKLILLICGSETPVIEKNLQGIPNLSILTPYLNGEVQKKQLIFHFQYITKSYKSYYCFFESQIYKILVSDLDYLVPMQGHPKLVGLIPNPINTEIFSSPALSQEYPIVIFHGINQSSRIKKGNHYFEEALEIVRDTCGQKVKIITVTSLPYTQYIKAYQSAHIVLDMVYALDQGYNALEAMAQGKVVFTGAGNFFLEYYKLKERVAVHALPDANYIADELIKLIKNPDEISAIGRRARVFVVNVHNYKTIAQKYLALWSENYIVTN